MSLTACAELVERGDPDRFRAVLAAPVAARPVLLPLYAFNLEVARAPWVTSEPMIGEMRLQWWRDALEEIGSGGQVRRHEVVTPLADVLDPQGAALLDRLVAARRWDLYRDPFDDRAAFDAYLDDTAAGLMWAASRALGAPAAAEAPVRALGRAAGLAAWLLAVPDLEARGRVPLVDGRPDAVRALAAGALEQLRDGRRGIRSVPAEARAALLAGWRAPALLSRAVHDPGRVAAGALVESEAARRLALLRAALLGRI
ncbi:MAG: squalene/phytoene synthase family protein [Rhodobacteraceae bacterium]|nr:squalene/phytoene synthase family protein [Paracoccaceae bacterium]